MCFANVNSEIQINAVNVWRWSLWALICPGTNRYKHMVWTRPLQLSGREPIIRGQVWTHSWLFGEPALLDHFYINLPERGPPLAKDNRLYCTRDVPLLLVFFPLVSWYSQWNVLCQISPIINQICQSWRLFSHGLICDHIMDFIPKMLLKYRSPYSNRDGSVH